MVSVLAACTGERSSAGTAQGEIAVPADAEDDPAEPAALPDEIFLLDGPQEQRGIEEFAPDLTPLWRGSYGIGPAVVAVRYVSGGVPGARQWSVSPCSVPLRTNGEEVFYLENPAGWSILIRSTGELPAPFSLCRFAEGFAEAYSRFAALDLGQRGAPSFPGFIPL